MAQRHYAVYHDDNRHTCIRVDENAKFTFYIPFSVVELKIEKLATSEFNRQFSPVDDYAPQRAAERYMFNGDKVEIPVTPEAAAHLRLMAGPAYQRADLRNDPAPDILPSTTKEAIMAKSKPEAAAKSAPAKSKPVVTAAPAAKSAPAKSAPAKKTAKPEPAEAGTRGRAPNIGGDAKIKVLVAENPKRAAAATRFALYKNGMTVDEYIALGGKRADVNWDVGQGFIEVK